MATQMTEPGDQQAETQPAVTYSYCSLPVVPLRELPPGMGMDRLELIRVLEKKWVNGTLLHFYFFDKDTDGQEVTFTDGSHEWRTWTTTDAEKTVVRNAFHAWTELGIGVTFDEADTRDEAEIRIGFMRGDGAWSYVGRDIIDLGIARDERTMNFGWDLTRRPDEIDTAIHEIGHTLGFPHEHQNPYAGIVWNEDAVYAALAKPPNSWSREQTFHNIIRKIDPDTVQGSSWDPDSVMHYPFEAGLILQPERYRNGLTPAGGLSDRDVTWVKTFYPAMGEAPADPLLRPGESVRLQIGPGEQRNFRIEPTATRQYTIGTFGVSDTVIVLFERVGGELRYVDGDDDSGQDWNANMKVRLRKGRQYVLRVRLYYADRQDETAVMIW